MGGEPDAAGNSQMVLNLQKLNSDQSKRKLGFLSPIMGKEITIFPQWTFSLNPTMVKAKYLGTYKLFTTIDFFYTFNEDCRLLKP